MRRMRTDSAGFTLLELILVLLIIAITLMAAAPSLAGFGRGRSAVNTAGKFVAVARWARSQAVSDGTTYRLNIDPPNGRWWLTKDNGTTFVKVDTAFGQEMKVPDDVKMTTDATQVDGTPTIVFDPSGRSDPAVVRFVGQRGDETDAVCDTPIDLYHVSEPQGGK